MKRPISYLFALCFAVTRLATAVENAESKQSLYSVAERGPNHRVMSRVTWETNRLGVAVGRTNSYTELETGMHYLKEGQWVESKAEIKITSEGAEAVEGAHKVKFAANLNSTNAVDLLTPDGQRLRSRIYGLAYYDEASGEVALIARTKDSIGELQAPNRAIYADAFEGMEADVEYIYTKAGFEQNVVLREQPPSPEKWNLNPKTTRLQVLTEFFNPPTPDKVMTGKNAPGTDSVLVFGNMRIGRGKAFSVGSDKSDAKALSVDKRWLALEDGRTFLAEEVKFTALSQGTQALPTKRTASLSPHKGRGKTLVTALSKLLPQYAATPKHGAMRLANANVASQAGYVLDYYVSSSTNDFTFKADTTYYVTNLVNLTGTTIIEGGTVIKFSTNASPLSIAESSSLICKTSPYRPAIFTAKDDDTVGESIPGSTGSPAGYYGGGLFFDQGGFLLKNLRISYAEKAFGGNYSYHLSNVQIVNSRIAVDSDGGQSIIMDNALLYRVGTVFSNGYYLTVIGSHVTVDDCGTLATDTDESGSSLILTNSLLVAVTNAGNAVIVTNYCATAPVGVGVFQTVGSGAHYLVNNSPYRNAGTTSIDATLAADLRRKTTYPPVVFLTQYITNDTILYPQAQRDTDVPDLGYHYDPIDWAFGRSIVTNATVTVLPGTTIGTFSGPGNYGLALLNDAQLVSKGLVGAPNWIVQYNTVQEQANRDWTNTLNGWSIVGNFQNISPAAITAQFTKWSIIGSVRGIHYGDFYYNTPIKFSNCEFYGGYLWVRGSTANITNCLFDRVLVAISEEGGPRNIWLQNCLLHGGRLSAEHWETSDWVFRDNLFDNNTLYQDGDVDGDYNGFVTGSTDFATLGAHDVTASLTFKSGPLGNFYQPSTSSFIDAGSAPDAGSVGLYHYTVATNLVSGAQVKEGNGRLDIGYHYVALNSSNNPIDGDGDGLPDYYEDSNGNGSYSSGTDLSDYTNADTDSDGVNDGIEVIQGRNPRVNGTTSTGSGLINLRVFTPLK